MNEEENENMETERLRNLFFYSVAKKEISSIIKDHILYIPYDTTNLTGINGYAAISKSWLSRKEDGHFSLPIISSYLFSSVVDKM